MANLVFDFLHHYQRGERRESDPANAYQYDEGHVIEAVLPETVTSVELHYWARGMEEAEAYTPSSITANSDGSYTVIGSVPNKFFETDGDLRVYIVVNDAEASITTYEGKIHVVHRAMPDDYVGEDPDNTATRILTEAQAAATTATQQAQAASDSADQAQQSAETLSESVEQIATNTQDITALKEDICSVSSSLVQSGMVDSFEWEYGSIDTTSGQETSRTDSVRTGFIPIAKDSVYCMRIDSYSHSNWWANISYYDKNQNYLGSTRSGTNQYYQSFMVIPSNDYPTIGFIRFTILNGSGVDTLSEYSNVYKMYVRSETDSLFYKKLFDMTSEYDILDMEFTSAGGLAEGEPYDIAQDSARFRTVNGYPFPAGSKLVVPDNIPNFFGASINIYFDGGRFYNRSANWENISDLNDYSVLEQDFYLAIAGKTQDNLPITSDMIEELGRIVKIAVPKQSKSYEDRLGGSVVGSHNLFKKIPFAYYKTTFPYETAGNAIKQVADDSTVFSYANTQAKLTLKAGTYHFQIHFEENTGDSYSAVAYKVYDSNDNILFDFGARSEANYDVERSFTLSEETTIGIQFRSYVGNKFRVYLYTDSYDTLKTVSENVKNLESYIGDSLFNTIYSEPIQNLILKYNSTVSAGNIGYIWISDLHVDSLYPDRNKALKRQLMACAEIANRTNIQFICIGGDIIDRETSYNTIYSIFNEAFSGIKESRKPIVVITGNHDDNPYTNDVPLTKAQVKGLFVDMTEVDAVGSNVNNCYYYFDRMGYRFICLDMIDYPAGYGGDTWWGFSQNQITWVANILKGNDKDVIILCHQTLDYSHNFWNLGNNGGYTEDLKNLLDAYNAKTTISLYNVQYDFSSATNKVLYTHAGHAHFDEMYTEANRSVPMLVTSAAKNETTVYGTKIDDTTYTASNDGGGHFNSEGWTFKFYGDRTLGTINEAAFDVVSVGESTVNVFRVGAGEDRSFNISR